MPIFIMSTPAFAPAHACDSRYPLWGRLASAGLALLLAARAFAAPPLAACDAEADFTILEPWPAQSLASNPSADAPEQAEWLNRRWLQWPGVAASKATGSRFVLAHARAPGMTAQPGAPLQGFDTLVPLQLAPAQAREPAPLPYRRPGVRLRAPHSDLRPLLQGQLLLVQLDAHQRVLRSTPIQQARALDDWFARAKAAQDLGVQLQAQTTGFALWAPTARNVQVCLYPDADTPAHSTMALRREAATGIWRGRFAQRLDGHYYRYLVDVFVPDLGWVRNRVTDPYALSLSADSQRSLIADLDDARLKPPGWAEQRGAVRALRNVDLVVYELHVRDFSISDDSVPEPLRGKYLAFTQTASHGMRHLAALARAGVTDVHLLPIFDFASVPERGCTTPAITAPDTGDSATPQSLTRAQAAADCFNWGYDPLHFNAPEGSYATDANDGRRRILELRQMVQALHSLGLRVGMDVVYNHTSASGQHRQSVLDRIVPGYYHRLNALGTIERSTCCENTATEHGMMGKLMIDSAAHWVRHYGIDSLRFDLMGHQPRRVMQALQRRVNQVAARPINLLGEGWNFGEVANGARFVQASQLSLNGSGIATFSDRARDALRGGGAGDQGEDQIRQQGYLNGLVYASNDLAQPQDAQLRRAADLVRVGLAGSIRSFRLHTHDGHVRRLKHIDYAGQSAGYVREPGEVVNYVENHDNQTLWDSNAFKLPLSTSSHERARVQMLGVAVTLLSQGVAYLHAGIDVLRSKSMDRNSFDSGDWFNRLDWSYQSNHFGSGLPPGPDNEPSWTLMRERLTNPTLRATPQDIAFARDTTRDLLAIRAGTTLLRLRTAADIRQRLRFANTGPGQNPQVLAVHLDGRGYQGGGFAELLVLINVAPTTESVTVAPARGKSWRLHPVQARADSADPRVQQYAFDAASGRFDVPGRSALVLVRP